MAAKSHRALKITGIVIGVIVGIALIAVVALNIYMRVAFAPFFDRAESPFDIPGINTGFVPQGTRPRGSRRFVAVQRVHGRPFPLAAVPPRCRRHHHEVLRLPARRLPLRRPRLGHHHQ